MSRFSATQQSDANAPMTSLPTEEVLFKPDRPRQIDRFIDYFGTTSEPAIEGGDAFMSALQDDE